MARSKGMRENRDLRALADRPAEQVALASSLLAEARELPVVKAAAKVLLAAGPDPAWAPMLRERFAWFQAAGTQRDQGGYIRAALLELLRDVVDRGDEPWLEEALRTYEFLPAGEVATFVRAGALLALAEIAPERACWHAVRLLAEPPPHTQEMTGEPAVTAARLLASQGRLLPLYAVAASEAPQVPDVLGECLRLLADDLPGALLGGLLERHLAVRNDVVLVGAIDLALGHADGAEHIDLLAAFCKKTRQREVHRYLAAAAVASRKAELVTMLEELLALEQDGTRLAALVDALSLLPPEPQRDRRLDAARRRLEGRADGR